MTQFEQDRWSSVSSFVGFRRDFCTTDDQGDPNRFSTDMFVRWYQEK